MRNSKVWTSLSSRTTRTAASTAQTWGPTHPRPDPEQWLDLVVAPVADAIQATARRLGQRDCQSGDPGTPDCAYRMLPVCPRENEPGCGHTKRPCGPALTLIRLIRAPVVVSKT
jgi:hypothetical protein